MYDDHNNYIFFSISNSIFFCVNIHKSTLFIMYQCKKNLPDSVERENAVKYMESSIN